MSLFPNVDDVASRLREMHRDHAEEKRVDRWHATYNAALTGLLAAPTEGDEFVDPNGPSMHDIAKMWADKAHGPLEAK